MTLLLVAVLVLIGTGLLALVSDRSPRLATALGVGGIVSACVLGLIPALAVLSGDTYPAISFAWLTDVGGSFTVALDPLSAFFLVLIFVIAGAAGVFGGDYLLAFAAHKSIGRPWFFYNILIASMILIVVSRNGVLFLISWEVMALTSYFLVTYEDEKPSVRRAGWIYLIAAHLATATLMALFVLLRKPGGSLDFGDVAASAAPSPIRASVIFVLALVGFGTKAGFVPLHVWLPEAHPAAPSHVSAVLSAVLIKMGVYGILRTLLFLGPPAFWWGPALMTIGLIGGLFGIALALSQRDLKRALAYSSIENMGLIALSLGVGLWGLQADRPIMAAFGIAGALLHTWNHALMKGMLFLSAGSILHGAGTKDIEQLGGIMKRMPLTGTLIVLGTVALSALPPMNVFVSEWLMYLGLLEAGLSYTDSRGLAALLAVGLLAIVGALAAICFVRLAGIVLLGECRTEATRHAHESSLWMILPMGLLAVLAVAIAVVPELVLRVIAGPVNQILALAPSRHEVLTEFAAAKVSLPAVGAVNLALWGSIAITAVLLLNLNRRNGTASDATWGCGYLAPTTRMQYTGGSFSEFVATYLLPRAVRPKIKSQAEKGLFPANATFETTSLDPVSEKIYEPFFHRWANRFSRLWVVQHGNLNIYLVYLLALVLLGLAWTSLRLILLRS